MKEKLQAIWNIVQQAENISDEEKNAIAKALKEADKEISIIEFKLDRTEKVKKTTTILLEQTIEELEQKRKAIEAQNRELEIETALEKVRSKAMAMHKSEDLHPAVAVVFDEMEKLDLGVLRCGISILDKEKRTGDVWVTSIADQGSSVQVSGDESFDIHPLLQGAFDGWLRQEDFSYLLEGDDLTAYYKAVKDADFQLPESQMLSSETAPGPQYCYAATFGAGLLFAFREAEFPEEAKKVMKRFADVFNLTYTRFLDLQKAEAQTREAQIEAGLERVRSRTMAMFKSDELAETAVVVFKQMIGLGIAPNRLYIAIINDNSGDLEFWITDENGDKVSSRYIVNINKNISIKKMYEGWVAKKKTITIDMQEKELEDWLTYWREEFHVPFKPGAALKRRVQNIAYFSKGFVAIASPDDQPETTINLLERFAAVFNLTYTRFSDLQQAEAQAKEATIETALEKVRGKAMAMHNSNDLSSTASMVFTELRKLGISPIRCGVGLLNKESRKAQLYSATSSTDGDSLSLVGWVMLSEHSVLESIYDTWLKNEEYYPELSGEQLKSYYELLLSGLSVHVPSDTGQKQYGTFLPFSVGCLYAWSETPYNDAEIKILKRFATIIDLTFRRYIELQKSEASAKEAIKQSALDRIRADIASMRTTNDLERITPLIWNELTILGVPFIRCGVFIMDEEQKLIHTFLSTPDGKAIAAFHLPYTTPGNIAEVLSHWQHKEIYINHWSEEEFKEFTGTLIKQGALTSPEQYLKSVPHGGFYLHFLPFLQGMLYVGNTIQLSEDEIKLIQSVADAFSTAYARYEDFNRLEAAKKQVDSTLNELQATQKQLIQSEKMASLGELTAGIAHEIQNPLNFVNNFSEVSNELIDEMKDELAKGNKEDAMAIVEDVKQNLEKINFHGKRADAIVKGMLQHSRTSTGQKELTDINLLADEYLRLAYHGLRAKDKSFNAKFETDLDKTIERINIVPQEIGRVILNLINNAFYAVSEKKKQVSNGYDPTVTVKTKKVNDKIFISVNDNGNGIPQKVLEKIFQPFFTTKPTGQGTGLGLSLSYDIVKAHGGELKVETRERQGSTFIIQLPNQSL
jgi:signal transduction histidine kinase